MSLSAIPYIKSKIKETTYENEMKGDESWQQKLKTTTNQSLQRLPFVCRRMSGGSH